MNSNPNVIRLENAAADWNEALPLGNGRLGAMVFGDIRHERLQLNEDTLWSGEPVKPADPDTWKSLEAVRQHVFAGEYAEATEACQQIQGPFTESYLPLGDLWLDFDYGRDAGLEVTDYQRSLDLDTATLEISYQIGEVIYRRSIFVSAPDQALVIHLTASQPSSLSLGVSLTSPLRSATVSDGPHSLLLTGRAPVHVEPNYRNVEPAIVYDDAEDGKGMRFAARLRADTEGGSVEATSNSLSITQAHSVTLFLTAATSFGGKEPNVLTQAVLAAVAARPFEAIYADHQADYQHYFRRVHLDLGGSERDANLPTDKRLQELKAHGTDTALAALYFQYGRYLLICSSRPGTQPANLQGIWNQDVRPAWSSNYTININTQMNYWPSQTTHLAELSEPLFALIDDLQVTGRDTAKCYYGAGGWCAHHNTDLWARSNPVGEKTGTPCWANWPLAGAWLTQHLWEHFEFGGDRAFLAERVYPALKGVSEFLLDFLVEAPDDTLVSCPSTSPENEFAYTAPDGNQALGTVTAGTTADLAIIHEVFTNTVEAARILGIDGEFTARIAEVGKRLPPYRIGEYGELREWPAGLTEAEPGHRHISHLYGSHPGVSITRTKTPELAQAVLHSLDRRVAHGGGGTGWSRAWLISQYARLGEAEKAHESLHKLLTESTYPNLLDVHPPFQIDGNFGGTAGIAEMLLQSHDGGLHLLPALPAAWPSGRVDGLRARGGFEVSLRWADGKLVTATVLSTQAALCTVRYGGQSLTRPCTAGESFSLNADLVAAEEIARSMNDPDNVFPPTA